MRIASCHVGLWASDATTSLRRVFCSSQRRFVRFAVFRRLAAIATAADSGINFYYSEHMRTLRIRIYTTVRNCSRNADTRTMQPFDELWSHSYIYIYIVTRCQIGSNIYYCCIVSKARLPLKPKYCLFDARFSKRSQYTAYNSVDYCFAV